MSCNLRFSGHFLPEDLGLSGQLTPYKIWRMGEKNRKGEPHDLSGVAIDVSRRGMDNYKGQFSDATKFLIENREALRSITERDDVEEAVIDFGLEQPEHPAFFRKLSRSLVGHAAICRLSAMPTPGAVFAMIFLGAVGLAALLYGKRLLLPRPMIIGIVLMAYPYFVSQAWLLYGIGALLTIGLFYPKG